MELTQDQKLYAEIVQKAWEDAEFKKALIENPLEAIESLTGKKINLPAGKTLVVTDQTSESFVYLNLLRVEYQNDVELDETQLEAVAGGVDCPRPIKWPPPFLPEGLEF